MNKKINSTIPMLITLILFCMSACKKQPDPVIPSNVRELLVGKKWSTVSEKPNNPIDYNGDGIPDTEFRQFADECQLDDYSIFADDGFARDYEGNKKCTETPIVPYPWELTNNNTEIKLTRGGESISMKIISISNDILVIAVPYKISGSIIIVTTTLKRI